MSKLIQDYTKVPNVILRGNIRAEKGKPILNPYDIALYSVIKSYAREDGKCFLTTDQLAQHIGASKTAVIKSRRKLAKKNLIKEEEPHKTKRRPRKAFSMVNIWQENKDFGQLLKLAKKTKMLHLVQKWTK